MQAYKAAPIPAETSETIEMAEARTLAPYSVLMSVYAGEKAANLSISLESMLTQTLPPDEIILVKDGPLTQALEDVISQKMQAYPGVIKPLALEKNVGLGEALARGLNACANEYVARMDSDDISYPERMEKQLEYLRQHPDTDIISAAVKEFEGDTDNIVSERRVPETHEEIARFAKTRSPFNHVAVVFKKSCVLKAGSYRGGLVRVEDHDLWMRMLRCGARCANISEPLVYVRCGDDMLTRRHGLENAKALRRFYREMYELGEITYAHYLLDVICACGLQLMPKRLHKLAYRFLRGRKAQFGMKLVPAEEKPPIPLGKRLLHTPGAEETRAFQMEILSVYEDVARVCKAHGLRLILSGGSCLGAVRHRGFIPWDDDMDTVMPRADYEEFKRIFDLELSDRYEMYAPCCEGRIAVCPFMKIVKKDSAPRVQPEYAHVPMQRGAWLDVVPMDYASEKPVQRICKGLVCDALKFCAVTRFLYKYRGPVYRAYMSGSFPRKAAYLLRNALGFLLSFKSSSGWYDLYDRYARGSESSCVTFAGGIRHYIGEIQMSDVFLPVFEGEFEGLNVNLPARAHVYLRKLYGPDYLSLPPENERTAHGFLKPEYVPEKP
ncbi:MAG: LicD family protein [Clostridia bacterium]|nr:LicD family protein [Clostridia bacterium]